MSTRTAAEQLAVRSSTLYEVAVRRSRVWFYPLAGIVLFSWLARVWMLLGEGGVFRVVGIDFSIYLAQARLLRNGQPQFIYDLSHIDASLQSLRIYTNDPSQPLSAGPVPYAPIFAWLMTAFTVPPPPLAFGLWTLVNLLGLAFLAWRLSGLVSGLGPLQAMLALLISYPVAVGLIAGQPTALLACAVGEWFLALRAGREVTSGLWLSLLLVKPQYGILIGPLLLWKGRWRAVLGVAVGGLLIVGASILVVGVGPLPTYFSALADVAPWGGAAVASPGQMVNWRALVLNLRPSIGPQSGLLLVGVAGLLTTVAALYVWRGPWAQRSWTFAPRVAVLGLATILVNYHSHSHGLTLFAVPMAASLGEPRVRRVTRVVLVAAMLLPSLVVITIQHWLWRAVLQHEPVDVLIWSPQVQILLVAATAVLIRDVLSPRHDQQLVQPASPPKGDRQVVQPLVGSTGRTIAK